MNNNPLTIKWCTESVLQEQVTELEADWLFNEDSLTQRLTAVSQQQFSIEVLLEEWQTLRQDEYQKLAAPIDKKGWVREVFLKGCGEPWVYARSVALQTDLKNDRSYWGKSNICSVSNLSVYRVISYIGCSFYRCN